MMTKFLITLGLLSTVFLSTSCSFTHVNNGNVLVLAVDRLQVNDVLCNKEARAGQKSGFEILCKNSVRFTHAFTTSLLSLPAMTSLLTGLYPFQHSVRDNGQNFLSAKYLTTAELAFQKGYTTGFFTAGAPLLRSSGLQQGFALFDDSVTLTPKKIFRPASESFQAFLNWSKDQEAPFFSVIYLSDLLFKNKETHNDFGEARNLSYESQMEEIDSALFSLLTSLKKNHQWDQTMIVLVGLNGHPSVERVNTIGNLNLHSEQTQIALFIKPQGKPRDEGLSWSFDYNVSIADIGATLLEAIGEKYASTGGPLSIISIFSALKTPHFPKTPERWLLTESLWGPWRHMGPPVFAFRKENLLYIHDGGDHYFNTLIDKMEISPIPNYDSLVKSTQTELAQVLSNLGGQELGSLKDKVSSIKENTKIFNLDLWTKNDLIEQRVKILNNNKIESSIFDSQAMLAREMIRANSWEKLQLLGQQNKNLDWEALANRNLNREKIDFKNPCLAIIDKKIWNDAAKFICKSKNLSTLIDMIALDFEKEPLFKDYHKRKLALVWKDEFLFSKIVETNLGLELIWNLSPSRIEENSLFMLALSHPTAQKTRNMLLKEMGKE